VRAEGRVCWYARRYAGEWRRCRCCCCHRCTRPEPCASAPQRGRRSCRCCRRTRRCYAGLISLSHLYLPLCRYLFRFPPPQYVTIMGGSEAIDRSRSVVGVCLCAPPALSVLLPGPVLGPVVCSRWCPPPSSLIAVCAPPPPPPARFAIPQSHAFACCLPVSPLRYRFRLSIVVVVCVAVRLSVRCGAFLCGMESARRVRIRFADCVLGLCCALPMPIWDRTNKSYANRRLRTAKETTDSDPRTGTGTHLTDGLFSPFSPVIADVCVIFGVVGGGAVGGVRFIAARTGAVRPRSSVPGPAHAAGAPVLWKLSRYGPCTRCTHRCLYETECV
jgi:hypothetical protein